jgi:hypothetical protein
MKRPGALTWILCLLLAGCIVRLWLLPLSSSFWVDEMVTAFVVHYGPAHPSLAVAPQVTETIYYSLPRMAERLLGFHEIVYRLPSTLLMACALYLVFRLAQRLIHPDAGWFAVFACLTLKVLNYEAADARPYALGTCVAAAGLWFLVRWMDTAHWRDGALFGIFAALLWRVHLIYWPFYLVFVAYTVARLVSRDTQVTWARAVMLYGLIGAALIPVALHALAVLGQAKAHVIADHLPTFQELDRTFKWSLVAGCGAGALLLGHLWKASERPAIAGSAVTLVLGWWLAQPLSLFAFSWITANSVFIDRYLSVALPGAALAATLAVGYSIPSTFWKTSSAVFGAGVLLFMGHIRELTPPHHNSDWRAAARSIRQLDWPPSTPVLYPSPFIEAQTPVWQPDYSLPGFLYCHLLVYSAPGKPYLLPFESSPEAERYASSLATGALMSAGRFVIYGGDHNVRVWRNWFARQPELRGWTYQRLGPFGDVDVAIFINPARGYSARNSN